MHISLDSALGREQRLNSLGESVLQIAPSAAAAYSLRSLTGGDPKVVRVRRDTDNAEQDFTASEVSASALTSFTNADYAKYTSDFSAGDNSWGSFDDVTETGNIDGIGGLDNNLRLAIGSATSGHRAFRSSILPIGQKFNFSARVFIPSTNSDVDSFVMRDAVNNSIVGSTTPSQDEWVTVTANDVTVANAQFRINLQDGGADNFAGNGSDVIYLREVVVTQVTSDGFVETWYDQSGNGKDAVQATAGSQPKIVNAGSLLADGIFFDGTNDKLTTSALYATNLSVFSVVKNDNSVRTDNFMRFIYIAGSSNSFQMVRGGDVDIGKYMSKNTAFQSSTTAFLHGTINGTELLSAITTSSATTAFIDGSSQSNSVDVLGPGNNTTTTLGARDDNLSGSFFEGSMREVIIYQTDQTSNRVAVETNINSHYSIF